MILQKNPALAVGTESLAIPKFTLGHALQPLIAADVSLHHAHTIEPMLDTVAANDDLAGVPDIGIDRWFFGRGFVNVVKPSSLVAFLGILIVQDLILATEPGISIFLHATASL